MILAPFKDAGICSDVVQFRTFWELTRKGGDWWIFILNNIDITCPKPKVCLKILDTFMNWGPKRLGYTENISGDGRWHFFNHRSMGCDTSVPLQTFSQQNCNKFRGSWRRA